MLAVIAVFVVATLAASAPAAVESRQAVTELSPAAIHAFRPYALFSRAAACSPNVTLTWTCGAPCDSLPSFLPSASGGDGDTEQFWFVGYHPPMNSVIIVHQGTDSSKLLPILTDLNFVLAPLNKTLYPGAPYDVLVHDGFRKQQARTADKILTAVKSTLAEHPDASVSCTGHSLGAALSELDAVFLRSQLPATTPVKFVGYAASRVGNPSFANYADATLRDFARIASKTDPVPKLPPKFFNLYKHPSGEIHINAEDQWLACSGQDSDAVGCINDTGPVFKSKTSDHAGPYDGILLNGSCG